MFSEHKAIKLWFQKLLNRLHTCSSRTILIAVFSSSLLRRSASSMYLRRREDGDQRKSMEMDRKDRRSDIGQRSVSHVDYLSFATRTDLLRSTTIKQNKQKKAQSNASDSKSIFSLFGADLSPKPQPKPKSQGENDKNKTRKKYGPRIYLRIYLPVMIND